MIRTPVGAHKRDRIMPHEWDENRPHAQDRNMASRENESAVYQEDKRKPLLVVIPCLNEEKYLAKLVHELVASNQDFPVRIVIVDGASSDRTPEIGQDLARQYSNVVYLKNPKRTQSSALNLAVATYGNESDFLIRIDAHSDYPADYCRVLLEEVKQTKAASVVVAMKTAGKGRFQQIVAMTQNSKLGNGDSAHRKTIQNGMWVDHGHHALMRIETFRDVGGYDETFSHNEDAELDTRLEKAGLKIWLTSKTSLTYYPRTTPAALFRQYIRYGYGRACNILKHRKIPKLRQLAPAAILPAALLALASPLSWMAAVPLGAWAVLCLGYGIMIGIKTKSASGIMTGPVAMIMHFGWSLGFWRGVLEKMLVRF